MAMRRCRSLDLLYVSKPGGTPSPKEVPDQSKSSTENGLKSEISVNDAVQHVDFAKAALPFAKISCIKKLISKGESVCKLTVGSRVTGTGFVLFDDYIMTNAHLFKENSLKNNKLTVTVIAQFAYENQLIPPLSVNVDSTIIDIDREMDYAVLKLTASGQMLPEGLLKEFGRIPEDGSACIIGHPAGSEKKMDLTFIIEKDKRQEAAGQQVKDKSLIEHVNQQNIMKSDHVITYDTYMFGGASGSPMFDEESRLVGMHSAGVVPKGQDLSVIEYARPVLEIFKRFVENLRNQNQTELLERIREIAETSTELFDETNTELFDETNTELFDETNTELPNPDETQKARHY